LTSQNLIDAGHFLPGGLRLAEGIKGINETYLGWIEIAGERIRAYVKFLTPWEIFNEVLGSILCDRVGLPTPKAYLVLTNRSDYPESLIFQQINTDQILAFASEAKPAASLSRQIHLKEWSAIRELVNSWAEWPEVLLFDQWIANPDRHTGNILLGAPGEFFLIDHGLCFHRRNWTPSEMIADISMITVRLWTDFLQQHVSLAQRLEAKPKMLNASMKQCAVNVVESVALTRVQSFIPASHLVALVQFLQTRRTGAVHVVCNAMGVPELPLGDST